MFLSGVATNVSGSFVQEEDAKRELQKMELLTRLRPMLLLQLRRPDN